MDSRDQVAPAVFGAAHMDPLDSDGELPEQVFLPCERITRSDEEVTLELRHLTDGTTAMLAYTSLDSLVAGCGNGQPWVAVEGNAVDDLHQRAGADVVLWDAAVPLEQRRAEGQA